MTDVLHIPATVSAAVSIPFALVTSTIANTIFNAGWSFLSIFLFFFITCFTFFIYYMYKNIDSQQFLSEISVETVDHLHIEQQIMQGARAASVMLQLEELILQNPMLKHSDVVQAKLDYLEDINIAEQNEYYDGYMYLSDADIEMIIEEASPQWLIKNLNTDYAPIKRRLHLLDADRLIGVEGSERIFEALEHVTLTQFKSMPVTVQQAVSKKYLTAKA